MTSRVRNRLLIVLAVLPAVVLLGGALLSKPAQAPPAAPSRRIPDIANEACVYVLPGMDQVRVTKDVAFATPAGGPALKLDVYLPPEPTKSPPPVVVFVNGVGGTEDLSLRHWGIYRSWAQLVAVTGMAAVLHDVRRDHAAEDARAALAHVHGKAKELGIDGDNVILWSSSANVRVGWPLSTDPANDFVKGAVVYYGAPDTTLRRLDLPILVGRAGLDPPFTNRAIDTMAARALALNAPVTVMNVANGHHAFDLVDDDDQSRAAVRATLDWMAAHLSPGVRAAQGLRAEEMQARRLVQQQDWAKAEPAVGAWLALEPDNPQAIAAHAQVLYQLGRHAEAAEAYVKTGDAGYMPGIQWYNAACSYARVGRKDRALELLAKAVQTGMIQDRSSMRRDPDLESLRGDPRFEALVVGNNAAGEPGSLL
jgi:dienelactone hydrolase